MFGNEDIIKVAKIGKIFTPVITNVSNRTANIFTLENDGKLYVAVLNYKNKNQTFEIDLDDKEYAAVELWHGTEESAAGTLQVTLDGKDSALYELTPIE